MKFKFRHFKYLVLILLTFVLCLAFLFSPSVYSASLEQLVQQGIEQYHRHNYQAAIANWSQALTLSPTTQQSLIIQENIARAYQNLNQTEEAILTWQEVGNKAKELGDIAKYGRTLTEKAQIYLQLGQPHQALTLLCGSQDETSCHPDSALTIAQQHQDIDGEVTARGSLGEALRLNGNYDQSIKILETALSLDVSSHQAALQQSLGTVYLSRGQLWQIRAESAQKQGIPTAKIFTSNARSDYENAEQNLRASLVLSGDNTAKINILINLIGLAHHSQEFQLISSPQSTKDTQQALDLLAILPQSATTVYAAINLASFPDLNSPLIVPLAECPANWLLAEEQRAEILKNTVDMAENLGNYRAASFGLGALAHFYECQVQKSMALKLTEQAILTANQDLNAKDSLYLWEWQQGRIFQSQEQTKLALKAYQQAFNTLENIRSELLTAERDLQLDFRASIEPIYRQLAKLSLELNDYSNLSSEKPPQDLNRALEVIDALRLAELQNYFGNDCIVQINSDSHQPPTSALNTAIINSIIFEDKTAIILNLGNGEAKIHWIDQNKEQIAEILTNFRQSLVQGRLALNDYDTSFGEILYDEVIRPFTTDLTQAQIKTLVFIQDGLFRTIPMAALFDGKQFLVEQYAIAITPSLKLTSIDTKTIKNNKALILGVTQETIIDTQIFPALENVPQEIATVSQQFANYKPLVDNQFLPETLNQELENSDYSVIHVATHAQFGTIAEDTFLVTGNNEKISLNQLDEALRGLKSGAKSVELLSLTACQTAEGDERSALGLAGVAVQAGVKSVVASLWSVPDQSTLKLVSEFYQNLIQSGLSKAEALQKAQIKLIQAKNFSDINNQYNNPAYWAPFIMIGDWS